MIYDSIENILLECCLTDIHNEYLIIQRYAYVFLPTSLSLEEHKLTKTLSDMWFLFWNIKQMLHSVDGFCPYNTSFIVL